MHKVHEVLQIISQQACPEHVEGPSRLAPRLVKIDAASGCRLAQNVLMDLDSPPFDRALLDGFAVRAADALAGAQLQIIGRHDAGATADCTLAQGQCVAINTGAPIPANADAIAMVEHVKQIPGHPDFIHLAKTVIAGTGIQRRGSDARAGQPVLLAGALLTPAALAAAATAGAHHLHVHPRPTIAVLVTGDELVPIDQHPGPSQIRNSNSILLTSLLQQLNQGPIDCPPIGLAASRPSPSCDIIDLGVAKDDATAIRTALTRGFASADVVVVSGGMSMGTRDLVPKILLDLGVHFHVEKVKIKPGKPFIFGTLDTTTDNTPTRKYAIGLPGNPVSGFMCVKRFVEPLLRILQGLPPESPLTTALCPHPLEANADREFYQPCLIDPSTQPPTVTPLAWKGSADVFTLAQAHALIVHPINAPPRPAGSMVDILLL